jgi:hypothetical protein
MKRQDTYCHSAVAESNRRRAEEQSQLHRTMVREVVLASGLQGVQMADMVARLHFSESTIRKYLMEMYAAGIIERTHNGGQSCRWGAPGIYDAFAERRALASRSTAKRNGWQRQKDAEAVAAYDWANRPIVRALVKASEVPPLRPAGPASVWQLAA